jgi:hypothetical protein
MLRVKIILKELLITSSRDGASFGVQSRVVIDWDAVHVMDAADEEINCGVGS